MAFWDKDRAEGLLEGQGAGGMQHWLAGVASEGL